MAFNLFYALNLGNVVIKSRMRVNQSTEFYLFFRIFLCEVDYLSLSTHISIIPELNDEK